jgi:hypothetical protein
MSIPSNFTSLVTTNPRFFISSDKFTTFPICKSVVFSVLVCSPLKMANSLQISFKACRLPKEASVAVELSSATRLPCPSPCWIPGLNVYCNPNLSPYVSDPVPDPLQNVAKAHVGKLTLPGDLIQFLTTQFLHPCYTEGGRDHHPEVYLFPGRIQERAYRHQK